MTEITTDMVFKLKTDDMQKADALMKKMLNILDNDELDMIGDCKISKTLFEVTQDASIEEE